MIIFDPVTDFLIGVLIGLVVLCFSGNLPIRRFM